MPCRLLFLAFVLACTRSSLEPPRTLPNDAYIWQRVPTPALADAIAQSREAVAHWRVLTGEIDASGRPGKIAPDWQALAASGKPVILVQRIDGRAELPDAAGMEAATAEILASAGRAGVTVSGVEIDFDCATSKLPAYARFLTQFRSGLPAGLRLSATALPTWLSSLQLQALFTAVDETVLQVHAVADPKYGLFDPDLAYNWIEVWAERDPKPFRVALPAYGVRVNRGSDGRIVAVTGEADGFVEGASAAELVADPYQLTGFVRRLQSRPPDNLAGLVWFRLPTNRDGRAWSLSTWLAVLQGNAMPSTIGVVLKPGSAPGSFDILLSNPDELDGFLPQRVEFDRGCQEGEGVNGYSTIQSPSGLRLQRTQIELLGGNTSRIIGWVRCSTFHPDFHVEP